MKTDCPVCHAKGSLKLETKTENIPYFGEVMESTVICDECGFKWEVADHTKNVFLRLISEAKNLGNLDMRQYIRKTYEELTQLFPKIYLKFKDLQDEGKLPSLKRKLSKTRDNDPFRIVAIHKEY